MRGARENKVVRTKLVDVLKTLHFWLVDEGTAVAGQLHGPIDDVVDRPGLHDNLIFFRHLVIVHYDDTLLGG